MKIDKHKLVDLLVDKTKMGKNQIEDQLDQLIDRIIEAVNRGKSLEIKDFGNFYFDQNGELKFEPARELSTEISFKYAGMKPVEIKPGRDAATSLPDDEEKDYKDLFQETEDEQAEEPEFVEAAEDEEDDAFDFLLEAVEEGEAEAGLRDEVAGEEAEEKRKPEEEKKKKIVAAKRPGAYQRKKNNSIIWVIAVIILLIILGVLYFYFMEPEAFQESFQLTEDTRQQADMPEESAARTDENTEITLLSEGFENETEQDQTETVTENVENPPILSEQINEDEQAIYGLLGSVVENANNGYSIVLHSFNSEENARTAAAQLSEEGYRVLVGSRINAEGTMWRVSVGQFSTLNDALGNIDRLPPPYNTQNFIHRIQNN